MWNKYLAILYILWSIFAMGKIEAQSQASASAVAVAGYQETSQPNPVVYALAQSISEGLQHSPVLGDFADFVIDQPYEFFYEICTELLDKAGMNDTGLAKHVADTAGALGKVSSELYFGAASYTTASVLCEQGIATMDNVDALSLMSVSVVGAYACVNDLSDSKSVVQSVVSGLFDVLKVYGLVNYDIMVYIFYIFAEELKVLSGVSLGIIESQSQASAVAVTDYQIEEPFQQNPLFTRLAQSLTEGLQHSAVLGDLANFAIYQPYDLFYKLSMSFLDRAGVNDSALATYVAEAVQDIGVVTSALYFRTAGYNMANVLLEQGIVTMDNVDALSLSVVNAIEVAACVDGVTDPESVILAVINGFSNIMDAYGIVNHDNMAYLFYHFSEEMKMLASVDGK